MSRPGQPVPPRPTAPSQGLGRLGAALGARLGMVWLATVLALAGTAAQATTLTAGLMGEVWFRADPWAIEGSQSVPSGARSKERAILEAEAIMAGRPADASFVSTGLDYPQGADTVQSSNNNDAASPLQGASVQDFLGTDFASFVLREGVSAPASAPLQQSLWRFTGVLRLDPLTTYHFRLGSDDGHAIWVGAVGTYGVAGAPEPDALRGPGIFGVECCLFSVTTDETGMTPFKLIFYERYGVTGLRVGVRRDGEMQHTALGGDTLARRIDGDAGVGVVPLPAAGWLLVSGLAGLGVLGRRRRRAAQG